ncbi:MAG: hypothetical protein JKY90_03050 [Gammaproteobacteria bacterium]|nr:hypothetical protein [Gammaproteobacteria bacterium]
MTGFSRFLARHGFRRGLVDHKKAITQPREREKPAFGGPSQPIGCVAKLARSTRSRGVARLAEWVDSSHQMIQYKYERV